MIKLFKLFGFGKSVKKAATFNRTAAFADYSLSLKPVKHNTKLLPLTYDPKAHIPRPYTNPEFKAYLSLSVLKKNKARKIKLKQLKAELKKQEEKARQQLFHTHEEIVAKLMFTDPNYLKKTSLSKEIKKLTDADMCLELLDYDGVRLTNSNKPGFVSNTNNILLGKIAKGGKSIRRTEVLIERFKQIIAVQNQCCDASEVKELVNAILQTGEKTQLISFLKLLKKCAQSDSYGKMALNMNVLQGITKAARKTEIPKEYAEIAEIIIKNPNKITMANDAAVNLSYFKGKFDCIAELMTRKDYYAIVKSRSEAVVSAGFRSALKDGKLYEYKQIVFEPENKYFPYMVQNLHKTRTPEEDAIFKQEISSKLLDKKFLPFLENYHLDKLHKSLGK